MRVEFVRRQGGPERLESDVELSFEGESPLAGVRLVGFSIWRGADGRRYVTFPARVYGAGDERRFFDYLRPVEGDPESSRRVKAWILREYEAQTSAA